MFMLQKQDNIDKIDMLIMIYTFVFDIDKEKSIIVINDSIFLRRVKAKFQTKNR